MVGVIATLLLALSACSGDAAPSAEASAPDVSAADVSSIPADGTTSADGLVIKDHATGTLPSDPYRGVDYRLADMALDTRIAVCMDSAGLDYPVVTFDWNDPSITSSTGWSPARTESEAAQYGYHLIPTPAGEEKRAAATYIASQPASYQDTLSGCMDEASSDPMFADAVQDDIPFTTGAAENPAARSAMAEWTACMESLGIPDLPTDVPGPSESTLQRLGLSGADNANLTDLSTISEEEIRIATQDARCNAQSHYDEIVYGLTWLGQQEQVTDNQADFDARLATIETERQAYIDYIEQHRDVIG